MKPSVAAALLAACLPTYTITSSSTSVLSANESETLVALPPREAAQLVIAKLGARGFTLVDSRFAGDGLRLKLVGNRDFRGVHTIGSAFYAWVERATNGRSKVKIVGKPLLDHAESCPAIDGGAICKPLLISADYGSDPKWGIAGMEEAQVIRGVFAEIALDLAPADGVAAR
jgi:hypothetical protein